MANGHPISHARLMGDFTSERVNATSAKPQTPPEPTLRRGFLFSGIGSFDRFKQRPGRANNVSGMDSCIR